MEKHMQIGMDLEYVEYENAPHSCSSSANCRTDLSFFIRYSLPYVI